MLRPIAIVSAAVLALLFAWCTGASAAERAKSVAGIQDPLAHVYFLDIGQGDATLIRTADGKVMLIDTGPKSARKHLMPRLAELGITKIDALVLTHAHADHIGNAVAIMEAIPTSAVLDSGHLHRSVTYAEMLEYIEAKGIKFVKPRKGLTLNLGEHVKLNVLAPEEPMLRGTRSDPNSNSIVLLAAIGDFRLLLTGDAEAETEERLLHQGEAVVAADVLKVAHHGSRYASQARFLKAVGAKTAVISCRKDNNYGHPAPETLDRLRAAKAEVFVTADAGEVHLVTNGARYAVETLKAPEQLGTLRVADRPRPTANGQVASVGAGAGSLININTASESELVRLKGIGPAKARRIVESRVAEGPFRSVDDITRVKGIGGGTLSKIRDQITIEGGGSVPSLAVAPAAPAPTAPLAASVAAPVPDRCRGRIDINAVSATALALIEGIDLELGRAIVARREQRGPFTRLTELAEFDSIDEDRVRAFASGLCAGSGGGVAGGPTVPAVVSWTGPSGGLQSAQQPVALPSMSPAQAQALGSLVCVASQTAAPAGRLLPPGESALMAAPNPSIDPSGRIELNTASESELVSLPGIGPKKAERIVQLRTERGRFSRPDELMDVKGIGPATFRKLEPQVYVAPATP